MRTGPVWKEGEIISVISTVLGTERNTKGEETVSEFKAYIQGKMIGIYMGN